jgi:hypothetical protein
VPEGPAPEGRPPEERKAEINRRFNEAVGPPSGNSGPEQTSRSDDECRAWFENTLRPRVRAVLLAAAAGDAAHYPGLVGKLACALDVFRGLGGQESAACRPRPLDVSGVISALPPSDVEKALKFITSFVETLRTTTGSAAIAPLVPARADPVRSPLSPLQASLPLPASALSASSSSS